jgi:hypothetical protein
MILPAVEVHSVHLHRYYSAAIVGVFGWQNFDLRIISFYCHREKK